MHAHTDTTARLSVLCDQDFGMEQSDMLLTSSTLICKQQNCGGLIVGEVGDKVQDLFGSTVRS